MVLLSVIVLCCHVEGQPYCHVKTFSIRDGLAGNIISGMGQDGKQLMWFSTWNGLCCYDGYRFTVFRDRVCERQVLTTNRLLMVVPDKACNIWCATYDKRPYLFDTKQCKFVDIAQVIKRKFGIDFLIRNYYALANGCTWVVGIDGKSIRVGGQDAESESCMTLIDRETPGLISPDIKKVILDESGREWMFTDKGVQLYRHKVKLNGPYEHLAQIGGKVYFASQDGRLACYDPRTHRVLAVRMPKAGVRIYKMLKADKGRLVLATSGGIVVFNAADCRCYNISVQNPAQPSPEVMDMYIDSRQRIWAFGRAEGVTVVDMGKLSATWLKARRPEGMTMEVGKKPIWMEDRNHTVWLAPANAAFCYYAENARTLCPYPLYSPGLGYVNNFGKWFVDRRKNLWIAGAHDLTRVNFGKHRFMMRVLDQGRETRAACTDKAGNRYFGTVAGNVIIYDRGWKEVGYLSPSGNITPSPSPFPNKVYALYIDRGNRLWIGTKEGGLYLRQADGKLRHYANDPTDRHSLSGNDIYAIDQDAQGNIWIGTYGEGLNLVRENGHGKIAFVNTNNSLKRVGGERFRHIRRITHTKDGIILVSTTDGLVTFSNHAVRQGNISYYANSHVQGDTTTLATSDVMQTLVTRDGRVFVATMAGGLQEVASTGLLSGHLKLREIHLPAMQEGIIQSLTEDHDGNLWITRESSLDMYNRRTGKVDMYGPNDLGEHTEFCEALSTIGADGSISLGAVNGVLTFYPKQLKKSTFRPDIVFSSIQFQGETEPQSILYADRLEIPADKRSFTISFAALDYQDNSLVRYAYKMEGVDKEWNYTNTAHSASYSHFPAGEYELLVRSTNADGIWTNNTRKLLIRAMPTFWETVWAKMIYFLAFIAVLYASGRYYVLRRKAEMEHDMNIMKTKFFTEIGHKLRTPLTLIGGPVTEVLNMESLSDRARMHLEMVQRNSGSMLKLVDKMLEHNPSRNFLVDDANASVFKYEQGAGNGGETSAIDKSVRILVVEDNDELRAFLVSILDNQYTVMQAENGKKGLDMAMREIPDFIITDVMMPVMDGLTMIHLIKQSKDICHIPIIVLSAKASLDDRLTGLGEGIDDYITKPFSATYLRHRVENIIAQRKMLQQAYLGRISAEDGRDAYKLEPVQIVDADKEMMKTLMVYLEANIGNSEIKIEDLAEVVHLGRTVFYEKMRSIVGMSPIDFLRHIRLQRAEELVAKGNDTFSQIAYAVGFSDPKYFGRCFKKETGMTPSEYRMKAKTDKRAEQEGG